VINVRLSPVFFTHLAFIGLSTPATACCSSFCSETWERVLVANEWCSWQNHGVHVNSVQERERSGVRKRESYQVHCSSMER
jgi:hypothetical protein